MTLLHELFGHFPEKDLPLCPPVGECLVLFGLNHVLFGDRGFPIS